MGMAAATIGHRYEQLADNALSRLATTRGFLAATLAYLATALMLRVAIVPGMVTDDTEQLLHAQSLELGYEAKNPPLFTWLVWAMQFPLGIGVLPGALVRATCLFTFYACLYAASRQALEDKQLAVLAALSPVALWFVGWDAFLNYSHSVLVAACSAACLMLVLRIRRAPRLRDYVLLGVALGAGFLAKYNFVLFAFALLGSAFLERGMRHRLFARPFVLTALVAVAIALPHWIWLLFHASQFAANASSALLPSDAPGLLDNIDAGWQALRAARMFAMPFLLLFVIVFAPALLRRSKGRAQTSGQRRLVVGALALFLLMLTALAAMASLKEIRPSYMFAIAWLPLPAFLLLAPERISLGQKRIYITTLMGLAASSIVALAIKGFFDPLFCTTRCRLHTPYGTYATAVREAGFSGGTILSISTPRNKPGENLLPYFPHSRLISMNRSYYRPPSNGHPAPCLIVWDATRLPDTPAQLRQTQAGQAPLLPADQPVHTIVAPMTYSRRPAMALGYAIVSADHAHCP